MFLKKCSVATNKIFRRVQKGTVMLSKLLPGSVSRRLALFYLLITFAVERGVFTFFLLEHGYTNLQVSTLQISFSTALFMFEMPSGLFADRVGKANALCVGGLCKSAAIFGQLLFVESGYVTGLLFVLSAFGLSLISGSLSAALYGHLNEQGKSDSFSAIFSTIQFLGSLSLGLAMVLADPISIYGGWSAVYCISGLASALAAIPLLRLSNAENQHRRNAIEPPPLWAGEYKKELMNIFPKAIPFALVHAGMTPWFLYASLLFSSQSVTQGRASAMVGIVEIITATLVVVYFQRSGRLRLRMLIPLSFIMSTLMALNFIYSLPYAILAFAIANFLILLLEVAASSYLNDAVIDESLRASALSVVSFLDMIAIAAGFGIFGLVSDTYGPQIAISVLSTFPILGAIIFGIRFFQENAFVTEASCSD